ATTERLSQQSSIGVHREKDYPGVLPEGGYSAHCVKTVQNRHRYIYQDQVRIQPCRLLDQRFSVRHCPDKVELVLEQAGQALRKHLVIISDKNTRSRHDNLANGTRAFKHVPVCGFDRISSVPCNSL